MGEGLVGTDLLWRRTTTGQLALWEMDGTTQADVHWLGGVSDTNWRVVGTADLTGDAKPDIVWRNISNGQNAVWEMDGVTNLALHWLPRVTDVTWSLRSTLLIFSPTLLFRKTAIDYSSSFLAVGFGVESAGLI